MYFPNNTRMYIIDPFIIKNIFKKHIHLYVYIKQNMYITFNIFRADDDNTLELSCVASSIYTRRV